MNAVPWYKVKPPMSTNGESSYHCGRVENNGHELNFFDQKKKHSKSVIHQNFRFTNLLNVRNFPVDFLALQIILMAKLIILIVLGTGTGTVL